MKPIIFYGATGQAKIMRPIAEAQGYTLVALFDDSPGLKSPFGDVNLYLGNQLFNFWLKIERLGAYRLAKGENTNLNDPIYGCVTVGNSIRSEPGSGRAAIVKKLSDVGIILVSLYHQNAEIYSDVTMGDHIQIGSHTTIGANVDIKNNVIINSHVNIEHDCVIHNDVELAPSVTLCGGVYIKESVWVGVGSVILPKVTIGANSIIGAGSVVTRDVPGDIVAYGNPCIFRRKND